MAQLLPDKDKQRPLAFMLLAIVLIAVYWIGFHWFFERNAAISAEIEDLQEYRAKAMATIARRPQIQSALENLRQSQSDSDFFIPRETTNLAVSELTTLLKQTVQTMASDKCQVSSTQNKNTNVEERFKRATITVRMKCEVDDLAKVLYRLESGTPYVFIDNVALYKQVFRNTNRNNAQDRPMDVRFDMYGYLRQRGDV